MVIVDASDKRTRERLHPEVVSVLESHSHVPTVLVLNKVTQTQLYSLSCVCVVILKSHDASLNID